MDILTKIINHKIKEIEQKKKERPLKFFIDKIEKSERNFKGAIKVGRGYQDPHPEDEYGVKVDRDQIPLANNLRLNLIAEIKKASPSAGIIRPNLDDELADIVKIYNQHAAAISIVTDQKFFQGSLDWIRKVRRMTDLPILCKDFIVDEYQIYEARLYGANAILLITAIMEQCNNAIIENYIKTARKLNMDCLVEARNQKEIKNALNAGAKIIGVNNRDLETFEVDLQTTINLSKHIPKNIIKVSESGLHTAKNIACISPYVLAVLIGTVLMKSKDIKTTITQIGF